MSDAYTKEELDSVALGFDLLRATAVNDMDAVRRAVEQSPQAEFFAILMAISIIKQLIKEPPLDKDIVQLIDDVQIHVSWMDSNG